MSDQTLAARHHAAVLEGLRIEDELHRMVTAACGALDTGDDEEWTTDYYDNSIEVYGVGLVDLDVAAAALHGAGFSSVWLHQHRPPRNGCTCQRRKQVAT